MRSVWIGYDERQALSYLVARYSVQRWSFMGDVNPIVLSALTKAGLYTRPTKMTGPRLFDVISNAPMSTQFAISRFFAPFLTKRRCARAKYGWALFMDSDVLCLQSVDKLFEICEQHPDKALFCVHHNHHVEIEHGYKMDNQVQVSYARKNWSSVMAFNCDHPSNDYLTPEVLNNLPGRDLHRFCWLKDEEIGELDLSWNWLVNVSPSIANPSIVHFTEGGPWFPEYENVPYADEWRTCLGFLIHSGA